MRVGGCDCDVKWQARKVEQGLETGQVQLLPRLHPNEVSRFFILLVLSLATARHQGITFSYDLGVEGLKQELAALSFPMFFLVQLMQFFEWGILIFSRLRFLHHLPFRLSSSFFCRFLDSEAIMSDRSS